MIRKLIKYSILCSVAIFLASYIATGISYSNNIKIVFIAGTSLCLANFLLKPLIKLVMLPINIITLGLFSWLSNVVIFYIVSQTVNGFSISSFVSKEYTYKGFFIPSVNFNYLEALIFSAFIVSIIFNLLSWLLDD